jgi:hypothetical protein
MSSGKARRGAPQHGLEVVGGQRDLGGHVAGKLRVAVTVDRGLAGAEEDALAAFDDLTLVEAEVE